MPELDALLQALELDDVSTIELAVIPTVGTIRAARMPEERSFDRWQFASERARPLGYTVLGIGSDDSFNGLRDHLSCIRDWDKEKSLQAARELDLSRWLSSRRAELEEESDVPREAWPDDVEPSRGLWFPFDRQGKHLDPWWMLIAPAEEPWHAPVSLAYGNWNDCPPAHVHAALCRSWADRFGATLAAMGSDTIEFLVDRPPETADEAINLAMEHFLYCPDVIDQGYRTLDRLAARLRNGSTWSFWWD